MKKLIVILASALVCGSAFAQDETPAKYSLYGFIRNYATFDSRESNAGTQDMYFYMPKDENLNAEGVDLNAIPSFRMFSLTTRLGLKVSDYQFGNVSVNGAVEADFYCMNGSVATFRLRQAYVGIGMNLRDGDKLLVNVGQTWHPMAVDMPHILNLETGAPFNPFNRSPQIMAHYSMGSKITATGGIIFPMQFLPVGPNGKSVEYNKYGLIPEIYLGVAYKDGAFLGKAGVDLFSSKPVRYDTDALGRTHLASGRLFAVSPFLYGQYTKDLLQIKAKTIFAQSGEHMNLLSGYGISEYDAASHSISYTPMQDWASFVSVQYGKKIQFMAMLGYMKRFGTTTDLEMTAGVPTALWLNTAADTKIQQAVRFTPTIAWNIGKLTLSLEYNITAAEFGRGAITSRGLYDDGKWIANHRIINMVKFNF